ncbi:MAG: hypothetical protein IKI11_07885 [Neisseriaceae bacterium]|nr:hypothetical protein [Neisseriaceae bacterium]
MVEIIFRQPENPHGHYEPLRKQRRSNLPTMKNDNAKILSGSLKGFYYLFCRCFNHKSNS